MTIPTEVFIFGRIWHSQQITSQGSLSWTVLCMWLSFKVTFLCSSPSRRKVIKQEKHDLQYDFLFLNVRRTNETFSQLELRLAVPIFFDGLLPVEINHQKINKKNVRGAQLPFFHLLPSDPITRILIRPASQSATLNDSPVASFVQVFFLYSSPAHRQQQR